MEENNIMAKLDKIVCQAIAFIQGWNNIKEFMLIFILGAEKLNGIF